ncbi:MAG: deoxyribose-phosphate aldolase [Candidatus Micrarchaeales archaeon]
MKSEGIFKDDTEFKQWILQNTDQAALEPTLSYPQLRDFILENGAMGFRHVCVPITQVKNARSLINDNKLQMQIAAVVGFPHGNEFTTNNKRRQVEQAASFGAREVDFVINISMLRSDVVAFSREVRKVAEKAHSLSMRCKSIFETYYLSNDEIKKVARICEDSDIDVVKTSTGFAVKGKNHPDRDPERIGATEDVIRIMGEGIEDKKRVGIKPSGGIRNIEQLTSIIEACIDSGWDKSRIRIGSSSGKQFLEELGKKEKGKSPALPNPR